MKLRNEQRGMTFFGVLIILGLISFFALVTMKVIPLYMDHAAVSSALDELVANPKKYKQSKAKIRQTIDSQLYIDGVKTFSAKDLQFVKDKSTGITALTADYEAKTNLFKNIYVVIDFKKSVELPKK